MLFGDLLEPEVVNRVIAGVIVFLGTTLLTFVVGRYWGRYQASREWRRKQFLGRIIVSLNLLVDGCLKIRTIFERSLEEVFLNPVAVEKVRSASLRTTSDNPFLEITSEDRWYLLNFVLNSVAERFNVGLVSFDAGYPVKPISYLLFLTCEAVGDARIRKVRAMMVRQDVLENFPYGDTMPRLENEWHSDRILTLRVAASRYKTQPDYFMRIELYV